MVLQELQHPLADLRKEHGATTYPR